MGTLYISESRVSWVGILEKVNLLEIMYFSENQKTEE